MDEDVLIIGGGPAGFVAAFTASRLGGKVLLVEKEKLGGVCVHWGCIPMCFMEHFVGVLQSLRRFTNNDVIDAGKVSINYDKLISEKEEITKGVAAGMAAKLKADKVQVMSGAAKVTSPNEVEIKAGDGSKKTIRTDKIIVAAGSVAKRYEIPGAYGSGVLTAKELLNLTELPKSLVIIGRSVTALELAAVWARLGSHVSVVARSHRFLPNEDEELSSRIKQALEADGIQMHTGVDIERIDNSSGGKLITISRDGTKEQVTSQYVVFALGQAPNVNDLGLENAGIIVSDGRIKTNDRMETGTKGVYAAGDIAGEHMLANVAMIQGMTAATNAMGGKATMDYRVIPRFVRTLPPMSAVGLTENEAKEKGLKITIGRFPFEQNAKANILRQGSGLVKIIADSVSGEILGVHIVGPQATEMIHEALIAMQTRGTVQNLAAAIHSHPCLHEVFQLAAQEMCTRMPRK
jgi:dihydrolipoamide dehydrogenase